MRHGWSSLCDVAACCGREARAAAEALAEMSLAGRTVVEIGAGTGLCSLAAASMGSRKWTPRTLRREYSS